MTARDAARRFTIRTTGYIGPKRHVVVRVHSSPHQFRTAAHALRPHRDGATHWDGCYGCFHPTTYLLNEETKAIRYPANGYAGTLRLIDQDALHAEDKSLSFDEIVFHELVHAATTIYRMNVARTVNLGGGRGRSFEHEEEFAYIYGELAADMRAKL